MATEETLIRMLSDTICIVSVDGAESNDVDVAEPFGTDVSVCSIMVVVVVAEAVGVAAVVDVYATVVEVNAVGFVLLLATLLLAVGVTLAVVVDDVVDIVGDELPLFVDVVVADTPFVVVTVLDVDDVFVAVAVVLVAPVFVGVFVVVNVVFVDVIVVPVAPVKLSETLSVPAGTDFNTKYSTSLPTCACEQNPNDIKSSTFPFSRVSSPASKSCMTRAMSHSFARRNSSQSSSYH